MTRLLLGIRDISVGTECAECTEYTLPVGTPRNRFSISFCARDFSLLTEFRPALWLTQRLSQWLSDIKQPGREANR